MIKNSDSEEHAVIFESANALFTRDEVLRIVLEKRGPYDPDVIEYVGIFELKDGRFGSIQCKYDPSNIGASDHKFLVAPTKEGIIRQTLTKEEEFLCDLAIAIC